MPLHPSAWCLRIHTLLHDVQSGTYPGTVVPLQSVIRVGIGIAMNAFTALVTTLSISLLLLLTSSSQVSKARRRCPFVLAHIRAIPTVLLGIDITQWSSVFTIGYYILLLLRDFFDQSETREDRRPACLSVEHLCLRCPRSTGSSSLSRL